MSNTFRLDPIHKNSPSLARIIKGIERDGYFYWNQRKCKPVNARRELNNVHLEVEYIKG